MLALACAPAEQPWTLARGLRGVRAYEVHVPELEAPALGPAARDLAARIRRARGLTVSVVRGQAASDASAARLVLALPSGAPPLPPGTSVDGTGFAAFGAVCAGAGDALIATFEDPARPGLPLTVVLANRVEFLVELAQRVLPAPAPGLSVWRAGLPWKRVALARDGAARGTPWTSSFAPGPELASETSDEPGEPGELGELGELAPARAAAARAAAERVAGWLGAPAPPPELVLFASEDELADAVGAERPWFVSADGAWALACESADWAQAAALAEATARRAAGPSRLSWLAEAVGVAAADRWYGRGLASWVAHLLDAGLALSTAELLDGGFQPWSDHRRVPLRAALVRWILAERGAEGLRGLWQGTARLEPGSELDRVFDEWLSGWVAAERRGAPTEGRAVAGAPWRGAVLVEEPERPATRYLAPGTARAQEQLLDLGASAFGLCVLPSLGGVERRFADRAEGSPFGSVSDLALITAARGGRARGLVPVLLVEPLSQPGGQRAGGGEPAALVPPVLEVVFDRLEGIALHYALVAELAGVELLVLGAELDFLARTSWEADSPAVPALREKLEHWRALLAGVRGAYGGQLTYAARGPQAIWETAFWDDLDGVGAHLFPRFTQASATSPGEQEDPTLEARWTRRLRDLARLARERKRPLFVTQVGFPANAFGAEDARVPRGAPDAALGRRGLAALAAALETLGTDAPTGLLLWRLATPAEGARAGGGHLVVPATVEPELRRLFAHR